MILDEIVKTSQSRLAERKSRQPLAGVIEAVRNAPPTADLAAVLSAPGLQLIAEVKKASPSKGVIRADFNPADIARVYAQNGAAAISVLTEPDYFQGSLEYLGLARKAVGPGLPLLCKDFIYDPYQVYEARAAGADAILLIGAVLEPGQLAALQELAEGLGMKCLVEVHDEAELKVALGCGASIIGINNRNLHTFEVDIHTTERLVKMVPPGKIIVGESGIKTRADIELMRDWNVDAVLVGEALTASADIAGKMKELFE